LNFQKDDFDSVWRSTSPDSLSNEEQILFEESTETGTQISLWKDLELIQPIIDHSNMDKTLGINDSGNESGDTFDHIFNQGLSQRTEEIENDPMMSYSFDLATPKHPFEEVLLLPEDTTENTPDKYSPRSTVYYASSTDGEDAEDDGLTTNKSTENQQIIESTLPTGYPNSIHSYSQMAQDTKLHHDSSSDMDEEDTMIEPINPKNSVIHEEKEQSDNENCSSLTMKRRRRQRKSRVYKITLSDVAKNSPKQKKFSNGKTKLYALKRLADPASERARLNAINAKKNRELKKKEKDLISREVASLKNENGTLKKTAAAMRKRAAEAESELRRLQAAIRANQLEDIIKASDPEE